MKIELGEQADFLISWETYAIEGFIRNNEDDSCKEADIDATHELASLYFLFVI